MKQTINFQAFADAFQAHGRGTQFSYGALKALFNYYEELDIETGHETVLDVLGLCCEWAEYANEKDYYDEGFAANHLGDRDLIIVPNTTAFLIQN